MAFLGQNRQCLVRVPKSKRLESVRVFDWFTRHLFCPLGVVSYGWKRPSKLNRTHTLACAFWLLRFCIYELTSVQQNTFCVCCSHLHKFCRVLFFQVALKSKLVVSTFKSRMFEGYSCHLAIPNNRVAVAESRIWGIWIQSHKHSYVFLAKRTTVLVGKFCQHILSDLLELSHFYGK